MKASDRFVAQLTIAALLCAGGLLAADPATENASESARKAGARDHFNKGVTLSDQKRFADALEEFKVAQSLYPSCRTLYNIGQVQTSLGQAVDAVESLTQYLADNKCALTPSERREIEAELDRQKQKVGEIVIRVTPDGTEVRIDGKPVGKAPIHAPIKIVAGRHVVEALLDGRLIRTSDIEIAGQSRAEFTAEQPAPPETAASSSAPSPRSKTAPPSGVPLARPSPNPWRIASYGAAGLGLVGAGVGLGMAIAGQAKHNDALAQWTAGDQEGARQTESKADSQKTTGYVFMGVGGAMVVAGVVGFLVTAPSTAAHHGKNWNWFPWATASGAGAGVQGVW